MRVLVADANRDVRSALRLLVLESLDRPDIDEAADAAELAALCEQHRPDLLIADWGLAESVVAQLRRRSLIARLIVLSGDPEAGIPALAAGADCFVAKSLPPERLMECLADLRTSQHPLPA